MPKVWHVKDKLRPANAVYIGRAEGQRGRYGNPFKIGALWPERGRLMTRDDVCDRFEVEVLPALDVSALRGRDLMCYCRVARGQRCHGLSILRKANA